MNSNKKTLYLAILVAALGYFVDVYDLVLFMVLRIDSLKSLGLRGEALLTSGVYLLNCQQAGMLLGGILWGVLGDKKGRIQVLFGSILLYSVANIANGFVHSVEAYAFWRFLAGVGLAGEIGAGITLVSELMPKETRGLATTLVASVGLLGAVAAALVGGSMDWRTAYIIGGVMGLVLLLLRISVNESGLFSQLVGQSEVKRGNLMMLVSPISRFFKYLSCIVVGVPIWFVAGIVVAFSPEIGSALGYTAPINAGKAILNYSIAFTVGDICCGILSQLIRNRRMAILTFLGSMGAMSFLVLNVGPGHSPEYFYYMCLPLGFFMGYWAVFLTTATEMFGTNLRATVTTSVPNFVRGASIPMTLMFGFLKPHIGIVNSAQAVGVVVLSMALVALYYMKETFAIDLDYLELQKEQGDVPVKRAVGM